MALKQNKSASVALITLVYILATALAVWVFLLLGGWHLFARIFIADAAATLLVYIIGLVLGNASVYDPYWSVAPPVILLGVMAWENSFSLGSFLMLAPIVFWAVRLTLNWAVCFTNLDHQDWRYDMLREKTGVFYPVVSFVGIHFVPTIVVYLAMLPAVAFVQAGGPLHPGSFLGWALCIAATLLQLASDVQMAAFRQNAAPGQLIRTGLWRYSRHPNYLGEILMWWGVYIAMVWALPGQWALGVGALANTLLFLCVSIPLADGRYRRLKPGFEEYRRQTRMLLPLPRWGTPAAAPQSAFEETRREQNGR